jgi:hypothetical protein
MKEYDASAWSADKTMRRWFRVVLVRLRQGAAADSNLNRLRRTESISRSPKAS